jgi:hypothetical protein|tara:strand:+ start:9977 stop:10447 length:471 start_codon:yes stop_codon:yes gene_type:complete
MSNQGIRGYYQITETIKTNLLTDPNVNTVTTGDITEIDLNKQTIFPLAHIIVNNVTAQEQALSFNITIMTMDIVDEDKDAPSDLFVGNNNEQDVLNTQLAVLNKIIIQLRRGDLYTTKYQLDGDPACEPFYERFENRLAGWAATMDILIQNDINKC